MKSLNIVPPISPAEVLKLKYFEPSGLNIRQYSKLLGVHHDTLRTVLLGTSSMSTKFIYHLSLYTNTKEEFWHYLQLDYLFWHFLKRSPIRKKISPIEAKPISLKVNNGAPGGEILNPFLKTSCMTISNLSVKLGTSINVLKRIISGTYRIDCLMASKLAGIFNTHPRYWIDLQMMYEISMLLETSKLPTDLLLNLKNYYSVLSNFRAASGGRGSNHEAKHPGLILRDEYIVPSKQSLMDWCYLFCVSRKILKPILEGKREIPLALIVKLFQIFGTSIEYWCELQARFYSCHFVTLLNVSSSAKSVSNAVLRPADILIDDYLSKLNWHLNEFADHIGVNPYKLYYLRQGKIKVGFDLATRIGEALNMDPKFWLKLQLNYEMEVFSKSLTID